MKVKNIAFSGVMAAILMSVGSAMAADAVAPAISVASKAYVDSKSAAVASDTINAEMAETGVIGSQIKSAADAASAAQSDVDTLEGTVATLSNTVATKANADDVYTKDLVYTKTEADGKFETITNVAAKAEATATAAQTYTNTKIQELSDKLVGGGEGGEVGLESKVASNTLAIDALEGRADTLEGLVGDTSVATQIASSVAAAKEEWTAADNALSGRIKVIEDDVWTETEHEAFAASNTQAIATAKSEAIADADSKVSALSGKIGNVAEGTTVVQMIEAAKTEASYDDTAVRGLIGANATAIQTINDGDVMKSGINSTLVGQITTNQNDIATINSTMAKSADLTALQNTVNDTETGLAATKEIADQNKTDIATINSSAVMTSGITTEKVSAYDSVAEAVNNTETGLAAKITAPTAACLQENANCVLGTLDGKIQWINLTEPFVAE